MEREPFRDLRVFGYGCLSTHCFTPHAATLPIQMDKVVDIGLSDPTDWLDTSLTSFAALESALRCQVCKDFYDTPMITSCSHTFCSLCIRRCLSSDGKCPICRAGDQASKLRRNWSIQEVVDAFQKARPAALELARTGIQQFQQNGKAIRNSKRKVADTDFGDDGPARRTRSSQRQHSGSQNPPSDAVIIALDSEGEGDGDYEPEPEPQDGLVACPMCGRRMKEETVFNHLDKCEGPEKRSKQPVPQTRMVIPQNDVKQTIPSPERIPQLNYSLLKDNALKKKLQELGIPSWGPRQILIRRHTEWVDIYNSNTDSMRPRAVRELLRDLDAWERSQGGLASAQGNSTMTGVMKKDFDHQEWKGRHKDHFEDLIADARARRAGLGKGSGGNSGEQEREVDQGSEQANNDVDVGIGDSIIQRTSSRSNIPVSNMANGEKTTLDSHEHNLPSTIAPATAIFVSAAQEVKRSDTSGSSDKSAQNSSSVSSLLTNSDHAKKVPMFAVPEDPITDIDGGTEAK